MIRAMLGLYEKITGSAYFLAKPFLEIWSRLEGPEGMWPGRLGHLPPELVALGPQDVWLQAVSVGEVSVAESIVKALDRLLPGKNLRILVSASTPAGFARAISSLGDRCSVMPYPLDFPQVVRGMVRQLRPRVYASLETELWPNLLKAVQRSGGRTILLNGRISVKSFPRYMKFKSLVTPVLRGFTKICAISEVHARRLEALGAPVERISITGNAKFEGLLSRPEPARAACLRERLGIADSDPVVVAGSLRSGEESEIVRAYTTLSRHWPGLVLFVVPRHLRAVSRVRRALRASHVPFDLWSVLEVGHPRSAQVVVVDVIGPLFDLYGLATAAFVGGSLVPRGGQNVMEPAAWGRPVLYGPHVENFEEARIFLERHGGGRKVADAEELAELLGCLLKDRERRARMGAGARLALRELAHGAATRQAETLIDVLESPRSSD